MTDRILAYAGPLSQNSVQQPGPQASFDSTQGFPIARLLTIDSSLLQQGDKEEIAKIYKASKEDGAFYLDFSDQSSMNMMGMVEEVFVLSKKLFRLSEEEKMGHDIDLLGTLKLNG